MKKHSFISSDPSIMRGALVITGTRVPIVRILYLIKEGYSLEEVREEYPQIPLNTFKNVLDELASKINNIKPDDNSFLQA